MNISIDFVARLLLQIFSQFDYMFLGRLLESLLLSRPRIHHTEQRSEILSPSLSVNAVT